MILLFPPPPKELRLLQNPGLHQRLYIKTAWPTDAPQTYWCRPDNAKVTLQKSFGCQGTVTLFNLTRTSKPQTILTAWILVSWKQSLPQNYRAQHHNIDVSALPLTIALASSGANLFQCDDKSLRGVCKREILR